MYLNIPTVGFGVRLGAGLFQTLDTKPQDVHSLADGRAWLVSV